MTNVPGYYGTGLIMAIIYSTGMGFHSRVRLLALPVNIRLGWKQLTVTNTLAY